MNNNLFNVQAVWANTVQEMVPDRSSPYQMRGLLYEGQRNASLWTQARPAGLGGGGVAAFVFSNTDSVKQLEMNVFAVFL